MNIFNKIKSFIFYDVNDFNDKFVKEKITTVNGVMSIMGFIVFLFSILRYMEGNYIQVIADFTLVVITIFCYVSLYRNHSNLLIISRIVIFFFTFTSLAFIIVNPDIDTKFSWVSICVYLMYFLLGLKEDIRWIIVMLLAMLVLYIASIIVLELSEFIIFFIATAFLIFFLSRYEHIKQASEKQFLQHNKELKEAVNRKIDELLLIKKNLLNVHPLKLFPNYHLIKHMK